jgi:CPA2 family monovalent cation:H+ antiporter-2
MLFDPEFLLREPWMVAAALGIVLVAKPLAALVVVAVIGRPVKTGLTVALGLAQIGEFSFILGQLAFDHKLLPEDGMQALVAAAMISITVNPLLFGMIDPIERGLRRVGPVWRVLNARGERRSKSANAAAAELIASSREPLAVIVGYGPVGRVVDALLRDAGMRTVVVDMNIETVELLAKHGRASIYGDATQEEVLNQSGLREAVHLVLTLPGGDERVEVIRAARRLNPNVEVTVRARYLKEREGLTAAGASRIVYEEGESGVALARHVLEKRGTDSGTVEKLLGAIRTVWKMDS